ncbi:MAG: 7-cyano-7-deazaguanine synthase QueC [Gammaproteobacteria bacterium]|jgi:7-cyano-7-deazaguanine synthase|nr:7-cyano-7-deazaguanine synthase QueC [Gammaproteobacteria bacterium]MBT4244469.1 7-cyano-7-deazaguanine synthase QueC [Gammaproteobacteria bacterium]MBT5548059.1 7-cyano-7-deazaguanine synthase QueC [Gammaproteobacteria bacterium]
MSKAIVLLSGGLDSTTVLAIAKAHDFECYALSFDYGQKQRSELESAKTIANQSNVEEHRIMKISLADIGGSALTDDEIDVPKYSESDEIPVTYVPARNTIFLSFALAWAEVIDCQKIYIGVNALDYSGYPDCRPEFIKAFETMANLATKQSVEGEKIEILTPLISLTKAQIIQKGLSLGVDYSQTISCYLANINGEACGECDACVLRINGFNNANIKDPTFYQ